MNLTQMYHFWLRCGRQTLSGALHYLPAVAITWLVAGVAAGEVPVAPKVAQTGLLIVCLSFYTAAAAWARGLNDRSATGRSFGPENKKMQSSTRQTGLYVLD